jgi:histone demethylase JARID1
MNRTIVFSHEELVCKMAANPENLDLSLAKAIYDDMVSMVDHESKLQQELKDKVRDYKFQFQQQRSY